MGVAKEILGELDAVAPYQLVQKKFRLEHLMGLFWHILITLVPGHVRVGPGVYIMRHAEVTSFSPNEILCPILKDIDVY